MKAIVLRGIPGSGKSTFHKNRYPDADWVSSADSYFMRSGTYRFDPTKLSEAHGECFRDFIYALERGDELVIVDNTSIDPLEIAPYMLAAQAYKYEAEVISLFIDPKIAGARNVHGVPQETVERVAKKMANSYSALPPWWKHTMLKWEEETKRYVPA